MGKKNENPLVIVTWLDTVESSQWMNAEEIYEVSCVECRTVGWVIRKTEKNIVLASTRSDLESNVISIPIGCIESIRYLRAGKELELDVDTSR